VELDGDYATFHVFAGQIGLVDLHGDGATTVVAGETARIGLGSLPAVPATFDSADPALDWWSRLPAETCRWRPGGLVVVA